MANKNDPQWDAEIYKSLKTKGFNKLISTYKDNYIIEQCPARFNQSDAAKDNFPMYEFLESKTLETVYFSISQKSAVTLYIRIRNKDLNHLRIDDEHLIGLIQLIHKTLTKATDGYLSSREGVYYTNEIMMKFPTLNRLTIEDRLIASKN